MKKNANLIVAAMLTAFGIFVFIIWVHYINKTTPGESLNDQERIMLQEAQSIICELDKSHCDELNKFTTRYIVARMPTWLSPSRYLLMLHSGVGYQRDDHYEIILSDHVFDDLAGLIIFTYHEEAHVYLSHYLYYDEEGYAYEQCLDHNQIKEKTTDFGKALTSYLEKEGVNTKRQVRRYTELPGNTVRTCQPS